MKTRVFIRVWDDNSSSPGKRKEKPQKNHLQIRMGWRSWQISNQGHRACNELTISSCSDWCHVKSCFIKTCRGHKAGGHGQPHIHISKKIKTHTNKLHPPTSLTSSLSLTHSRTVSKLDIHPEKSRGSFIPPGKMYTFTIQLSWSKNIHTRSNRGGIGKWKMDLEGGGWGVGPLFIPQFRAHRLIMSPNYIILHWCQNVCITVWSLIFRLKSGWKDLRGVFKDK